MGGFHSYLFIYLLLSLLFFLLLNLSCFNWRRRRRRSRVGGGGGTFSSLRFLNGENISCNQFLWVRMHSIEYTVIGANPKHFFTIREGDIGYTLQSSSNSFGQYLTVIELKFKNLIFSSKFKHLIITFENFKQTAKWNKQ